MSTDQVALDRSDTDEPVLDLQGLSISIGKRYGDAVEAVQDVSFAIRSGQAMALIGESGSGKTLTAMSLLRLLPANVKPTAGIAQFGSVDLLSCPESELRRIRGNEIGVIFQEPMNSLNPTETVGRQISEVVVRHQHLGAKAAMNRAVELLDQVGIPNARSRVSDYPHRFSGGMRQRVLIARAIANDPRLLIADEPTTALDVTVQAQILGLLRRLQDELSMALLLVTHDLGVVAEACDDVRVMYAGQIVESACTKQTIEAPQHPYTSLLLRSMPAGSERRTRLAAIGGVVPALGSMPVGCRFVDRCPFAVHSCTEDDLEMLPTARGSLTRCRRVQDEALRLEGVS